MKIAVVGAGAVGCYFGGMLARGRHEVVFIARGKTLNALRTRGLQIDSFLDHVHLSDVEATDDPTAVGAVDVALVTVKSWQLRDAAETMRPLVSPRTLIVPLLNGVDAPRQLAELFGEDNVLGGMCKIGSRVLGPGRIEHFAIEPYVVFGHRDGRRSGPVQDLLGAFCEVDLRAEVPADVHVPMWEKFVMIAPWSGLGAVTRAPIGVLRDLAETRGMLMAAMDETAAVGSALGVELASDVVARSMTFIDSVAPGATSSMQRDIQSGQRSELMAQTGAVARIGGELGCATPVNSFLLHCLLPLELRARGELTFEL